MEYQIVIKRQAQKKLKKINTNERHHIVEKIVMLGTDPDDFRLDVKKLQGSMFFRLRVGDWRVIFDRQDKLKIIAIEKIKARGDVYK